MSRMGTSITTGVNRLRLDSGRSRPDVDLVVIPPSFRWAPPLYEPGRRPNIDFCYLL